MAVRQSPSIRANSPSHSSTSRTTRAALRPLHFIDGYAKVDAHARPEVAFARIRVVENVREYLAAFNGHFRLGDHSVNRLSARVGDLERP